MRVARMKIKKELNLRGKQNHDFNIFELFVLRKSQIFRKFSLSGEKFTSWRESSRFFHISFNFPLNDVSAIKIIH